MNTAPVRGGGMKERGWDKRGQQRGVTRDRYGVATISGLLNIIGLFGKRALSKRLNSAKETYNFKYPTNRSHPT